MTQSNSSVEAVAARLAAEIMAAVRSAKIPKVYAAEELDEFEALTLTPMLVAALASIPLPDKGVEDMVERLRAKWQASPATGGGSISLGGEASHYITDDGKRLINPDGPEAADLILRQQAQLSAVREAERERCAKICEQLAEEGDRYERECAGGRSWFNIKGDGQRAAAQAIRALQDSE